MKERIPVICLCVLFSVFLASGFSSATSSTFIYSKGQAEADGRSAHLELKFDGQKVTGKMVAKGVCKPGIRLPRTDIEFTGTLTGSSWEGFKSEINGRWKGGDYGCDNQLMKSYPTAGNVRIRMTEPNAASKNGMVYLTRIFSSTYGYLFEPLGNKYKPGTGKDAQPNWVRNPPFPERAKQQLINNESPDYSIVGPPASGYKMPDFSNSEFQGVIPLSYMETRSFWVDTSKYNMWRNKRTNTVKGIDRVLNATLTHVYVSANLLEVSRNSKSVSVKANQEGTGQVWVQYNVDFIDEDGAKKKGSLIVSWYVLVGKKALAEYKGEKSGKPTKVDPVKADIAAVTIIGKALRQGSQEPAGDARIYLVPQMTQEICRSNGDGSFDCTFNNQKTGTYELMIQKPSGRADLPPLEAVDLDLWPIKQYMVTLDKEKCKSGPIDVGTIWMERIGILCNNDSSSCRDEKEYRGVVVKNEKKSMELEKRGDELKRQGKYKEAIDAYIEAKKHTNNKNRIKELDKKILALQKMISSSTNSLSGQWAESRTHAMWTFTKRGQNKYTAHFRGRINVDGPATLNGDKVSIDLQVEAIQVHYDLVFSSDGQKLVGNWTARKRAEQITKQTSLVRGGTISKDFSFVQQQGQDIPWSFNSEKNQHVDENGFKEVIGF